MSSTARVVREAAAVGQTGARALKFSGHESFVLRYGWLPKLHEAVSREPELFLSDERAILALGLGRNMVKSIRFWGEAFGITSTDGRSVVATPFGRRLLDLDGGRDPYLESPGSLWRLHWNAVVDGRLGGWHVLFQEMRDAETSRDRLVAAVSAEAAKRGGAISTATAAAHADILVRTYAGAPDAGDAPEESLGCPLQELDLVASREHLGRSVVRLIRGPKPTLDVGAFLHALHDFWRTHAATSRAVSLRSVLLAPRSPGRAFALDEASLHERLEACCAAVPALGLREDGAGGVDVVLDGGATLEAIEEASW